MLKFDWYQTWHAWVILCVWIQTWYMVYFNIKFWVNLSLWYAQTVGAMFTQRLPTFWGHTSDKPHSSTALCTSSCYEACHLGRIKIKLQCAAFISLEGKWSSKPILHKVVILMLLLWGMHVGGNGNAAPVTVV